MLNKLANTNRDESYGHIRDIGTESIQFNCENSNLNFNTTWGE